MLAFLKDHPFAVEAFFESSLVLTFAVPKKELEPLIPECLTLDTWLDKWAFIAVAMVQTKGLRPKGLPKFLGNDFFLIGYRVFVRYINRRGKKLRGLYILKSETDRRKMEVLGNIFTHYNYSTIDVKRTHQNSRYSISSFQSDLEIEVGTGPGDILLPSNSPFTDWKEARRFAGPLPFTFTYNPVAKKVLIIEGVRQNWKPNPIEVKHFQISFLRKLELKGSVLASAFMVESIPYCWKKGKIERWIA